MDGLEDRKGVFIIAATNRPDLIDEAILRPGRLGRTIYVPLPDKNARKNILEKHLLNIPCRNKEKISKIYSEKCDGYSGADCAALVKNASSKALSDFFDNFSQKADLNFAIKNKLTLLNGVEVLEKHFDFALLNLRRSVSEEKEKFYTKLNNKFNKIFCSD
ncbi:hypothetical protein MHBO_002917 [Bonamia ostreae]|uniref:ATPase AAA-type core domain-containing protein n=1 Tax=Bonamia ostreae TaxID=126728 RepID=A0ABV2APK6_9EUKA